MQLNWYIYTRIVLFGGAQMQVGHSLSTRYNKRVGRREGDIRLFRYDGVFLGGLPGDVALPFARRVDLAPGEQSDDVGELPP